MEEGIIPLGTLEAQPHCIKCGSDNLLMPDGVLSQDDLTDESHLTCGGCGAVITYAALVKSCETRKAIDLIGDSGASIEDFPD